MNGDGGAEATARVSARAPVSNTLADAADVTLKTARPLPPALHADGGHAMYV